MAFPENARLTTDADHARIRMDALADQLEDLVAKLRREIARIDEKGDDDERPDAGRDGGGLD
jgi:hypothetical protein